MKICVYAIAKNESKFVQRWYDSVKEADYVCVLDTGSTDDTYKKLKKLNIITKQKFYENFRFDLARNDSMELIPADTDICVCVDIDEVFKNGWSKTLKENWKNDTTQARYRYTWNFNADGSEGIVFMQEKIHKYGLFKWKYPVHEILTPTSQFTHKTINLPTIQLNHLADTTKSRSNYLPLLELSVKENPEDDRNTHYLGREYYFHGQYQQAIETLKKHLTLKSSTWALERSASYRYIASCYKHLGNKNEQEKNLVLACLEAPNTREPFFELAVMYFQNENYILSAFMFEEMFKVKIRELNYMSSPHCWSSLPYDYLSICYYHLGNINKAIENATKALKLSNEERLKKNLEFFIKENNKI